ncbi:MAG: hypothetical protein Q9M40_07950 [Sulfurimonas sp.]|nr:hypothetical protein [Sulfurimonas sp.]
MLAAVGSKDYYYVKSDLVSIDEVPFETKLFFEDKEYYRQYVLSEDNNTSTIDDSNDYYSMLNLHYSGSDLSIAMQAGGSAIGSLNIKFGDPLSQNSVNAYVSRDDTNITIAGVGYENSQYILQYSFNAYGVLENDDRVDTRDYGVIAGLGLDLYRAGYFDASLNATYFQDYDTREREPLTGSFNLSRYERHGISMYANSEYGLSAYGVRERKDTITGATLKFSHRLFFQTYLKSSLKYSITDADISNYSAFLETRGVKLSPIRAQRDNDLSSLNMPTLDGSLYVKSAGYGDIGLSSVIDLSSYWFTFPLSLQREAIYAKYRYYDVKDFTGFRHSVNEIMAGIRFDMVLLNSFALPLSIDYFHNDNALFTNNENQVQISLGITF